jgi:hypothetical protein
MTNWSKFNDEALGSVAPGIVDEKDLDNGTHGPASTVPFNEDFADRIAWILEQLPKGVEARFYTLLGVHGTHLETVVVFGLGDIFERFSCVFIARQYGPSLTAVGIAFALGTPMTRIPNYPGFSVRKAQASGDDPVGEPYMPFGKPLGNPPQEFLFKPEADPSRWAFGDIFTRILQGNIAERFMRVNFADSQSGFKQILIPGWSKRTDPLHAKE